MFVIDHPIILAFIGAVIGYILKYVWDRYGSQSSRVTKAEFKTALEHIEKECDLKRNGCVAIRAANKAYFERLIEEQASCLEEEDRLRTAADETFLRRRSETRRALAMIMMTQIKICEALKLDCSDLAKTLIDMGAIGD